MIEDLDGTAETPPALEVAPAASWREEDDQGPPGPTMEQLEAQQRFFALCDGAGALMRQAADGFRRTKVPYWEALCDALALVLEYAVAGYPPEKMIEVLDRLRDGAGEKPV